MNRRLATLALTLALALTGAFATEFPANSDVLVTAEDGTIVGIGKIVDGEEFELELLADFSGFGTLVFTAADGTTRTLDVLISDGAVSVDFVDLGTLLAEAGFRSVEIETDDELAGRPEDAGQPDDAGEAAENADDNAAEGADNADDGIENADDAAADGDEQADDRADDGSDNGDDAETEGDDRTENE